MSILNGLNNGILSKIQEIGFFSTTSSDPSEYTKPLGQVIQEFTGEFAGEIQEFVSGYWERTQQSGGVGIAQLDDLLMLLVLIRFLIVVCRYNLKTGLIITLISCVAAYVWYSNFLAALFTYEVAFYKNSLTYRLGMDVTQIRSIIQAKVQKDGYQIRLSNPVGIIAYALTNGSIHERHRIDFISMAITNLSEDFSLRVKILNLFDLGTVTKHSIVSGYYYMHRKIIPLALRLFMKGFDQVSTFVLYSYMTRVNKRYCPYLIRWHWTMTIVSGFFQTFLVYVVHRITMYVMFYVVPILEEVKRINYYMPYREFEVRWLGQISWLIILCQLGFQIYSMLHAVCGQYYYILFLTENTEMHVGKRDKTSVYSGGYTAWQDPVEQSNSLIPKLWYGWFGKGTVDAFPSSFEWTMYFLYIGLFKPIYRSIRRFLRLKFRRKKK